VIRVSNYITPNNQVTLRFTAEDAGAGSLVEALVDDLTLNDAAFVGINSTSAKIDLSVYPNLKIRLALLDSVVDQSCLFS